MDELYADGSSSNEDEDVRSVPTMTDQQKKKGRQGKKRSRRRRLLDNPSTNVQPVTKIPRVDECPIDEDAKTPVTMVSVGVTTDAPAKMFSVGSITDSPVKLISVGSNTDPTAKLSMVGVTTDISAK